MEPEEDVVAWEEALDLGADDEDEPNPSPPPAKRPFRSLRRCSTRTLTDNTPPTLIPGPAGVVQSAMWQRRGDRDSDNPITTQECIRRAVEDVESGYDDDFHRHPWLTALEFVRSQGLVDGQGSIGIPLSAIKNGLHSVDKVPQMVVIVKSCTPNGLGDVMATLKDPTGTVNASIHHRVFTEGEFGKGIALGSALILQKVAVFSPFRSVHCLNITLNNVFKVIAKDGATQNTSIVTPIVDVTPAYMRNESQERVAMIHSSSTSSQGRAESFAYSHRANVTTTQNSIQSHHDVDKSGKSKHSVSLFDKFVPRKHDADGAARKTSLKERGPDIGVGEVGICEQQSTNSKAGGCSPSRFKQAAVTPVVADDDASINQSTTATSATDERPPSSTSKPSLPEWTDEQLDQLFAFD